MLLGGAQSSAFYDVAIINDTLAYAVGEIYMEDSTGAIDPNAYNMAKWNGATWELIRIQFYTFCGQQGTGSYRVNSIWAFSDSLIWVASNNSQIAVWNGVAQTDIHCLPVSVTRIWASNESQVYTVGANGQIGYFNGTNWQKLESGTTVDLRDVWGTGDGSELWASGLLSDNTHSVFLHFANQDWKTVWEREGVDPIPPYEISVTSLWKGDALFLSTGRGVFRVLPGDTLKIATLPSFPYSIRGQADNDGVVAGDNAMTWHWNGARWKELLPENPAITLYGVAIRNDRILAVGGDFSTFPTKAVIFEGRR